MRQAPSLSILKTLDRLTPSPAHDGVNSSSAFSLRMSSAFAPSCGRSSLKIAFGLGDSLLLPLPLQHQFPLELGNGAKQVEHQLATGVPLSRF